MSQLDRRRLRASGIATKVTGEFVSRRWLLAAAPSSAVVLAGADTAAAGEMVVPGCGSPPPTAMVGLVKGQRLRVSLFNHDPAPRTARVEIMAPDSKVLATDVVPLAGRAGAFTDFDPAAGLPPGQRVQVHTNVHLGQTGDVGGTVEVYDVSSGRTTIPTDPCFLPNPDRLRPASVGLAKGQTLRVNAYHHPHDQQPRDVVVELATLDGKTLASDRLTLPPGHGNSVDYAPLLGLLPALKQGDRIQLHINVRIPTDNTVGATIEVYDISSGATSYPTDPCETPDPSLDPK